MAAHLVNSADSHVLEPVDLWQRELPAAMRDRGPVTEVVDEREIVYIDGKVVRRDPVAFMEAIRPPGAHDPRDAAGRPRRAGHLGRTHLPVPGALGAPVRRSRPAARLQPDLQRLAATTRS